MGWGATLLVSAAVAFAAVLGYLFATARSRAAFENRLRDAESGRAGLEATANELRSQIETSRSSVQEAQLRVETETGRRVAAETALDAAERNLAQQREALERTKVEMRDAFRALASEALTESSGQFLELAHTRLNTSLEQASGELEKRKVAVEGLVGPLAETLGSLREQLQQVESSRQEAYGGLRSEVRQLAEVGRDLRQETGTLATALRQPRARGSWGELALRRAVELAGMTAHCDFTEQQTIVGAEGNRLRPDLTVHLPGGSEVVVDSKVPMDAFLRAAEAQNDAIYQEEVRNHAQLVRNHVNQLSSKAYWSELPSAAELVILFMPNESFFSAALECDPTLIEDALAKKVLPASPTTLIAALRSFALDWRQHDVEQNAARISALGKTLYERIAVFVEHLGEIRKGLDKANDSFNAAVGSFNERLLPSARRLREFGVSAETELPELDQTEIERRRLAPPSHDGDPDASSD